MIDSFIAFFRLSNSSCNLSFHMNGVLWAYSLCKRGNVSMTPGQNFFICATMPHALCTSTFASGVFRSRNVWNFSSLGLRYTLF